MPATSLVIQYAPSKMSRSLEATTGSPLPGLRMFLGAAMISRASACASGESGTWTAIWSPSKSALNARHALVDEASGAADVVGELLLQQFADDKRAEELQRHMFRQAALAELQFRA